MPLPQKMHTFPKSALHICLKIYHIFATFEKEYEIHKKRIGFTAPSAMKTMRSAWLKKQSAYFALG